MSPGALVEIDGLGGAVDDARLCREKMHQPGPFPSPLVGEGRAPLVRRVRGLRGPRHHRIDTPFPLPLVGRG